MGQQNGAGNGSGESYNPFVYGYKIWREEISKRLPGIRAQINGYSNGLRRSFNDGAELELNRETLEAGTRFLLGDDLREAAYRLSGVVIASGADLLLGNSFGLANVLAGVEAGAIVANRSSLNALRRDNPMATGVAFTTFCISAGFGLLGGEASAAGILTTGSALAGITGGTILLLSSEMQKRYGPIGASNLANPFHDPLNEYPKLKGIISDNKSRVVRAKTPLEHMFGGIKLPRVAEKVLPEEQPPVLIHPFLKTGTEPKIIVDAPNTSPEHDIVLEHSQYSDAMADFAGQVYLFIEQEKIRAAAIEVAEKHPTLSLQEIRNAMILAANRKRSDIEAITDSVLWPLIELINSAPKEQQVSVQQALDWQRCLAVDNILGLHLSNNEAFAASLKSPSDHLRDLEAMPEMGLNYEGLDAAISNARLSLTVMKGIEPVTEELLRFKADWVDGKPNQRQLRQWWQTKLRIIPVLNKAVKNNI